MTRNVTSLLVSGTLAATALALVGCGSGDTSQGAATAASTAVQREAASMPAPQRCPERTSRDTFLTIINKTESVLYPSAENWKCEDWSGVANPSILNGWAIGPGQQKRLPLEYAWGMASGDRPFTINFRFGTYINFTVGSGYVKVQKDDGGYRGDCKELNSRLLPGRFGPNTVRLTWVDCTNAITLEQVAPGQPPA